MKIHTITLTNFRGYRNPTTIEFNDLTVFVGRNDIGKSTILEALDLFFNDGKGAIKYDDGDINISIKWITAYSGHVLIAISFLLRNLVENVLAVEEN